MSSVNKAIIVGRLGQDPELKYIGDSGTPLCKMSVATSRKWHDNSGELQKNTEWHKVEVWGDQAEQCAEYLEKGRLVYIEGRLQTDKWTDDDGNDRKTTKIRAFTVQFLGSKSDKQNPGSSAEHKAGKSKQGAEPPAEMDPADPGQEPMDKSDFFNKG